MKSILNFDTTLETVRSLSEGALRFDPDAAAIRLRHARVTEEPCKTSLRERLRAAFEPKVLPPAQCEDGRKMHSWKWDGTLKYCRYCGKVNYQKERA